MADIERDSRAVMNVGKVICGISDAMAPTARTMEAIIGPARPGFLVDVALAAAGEDSARQITKLAGDLDKVGAGLVATGKELMAVEESNVGLIGETAEGRP